MRKMTKRVNMFQNLQLRLSAVSEISHEVVKFGDLAAFVAICSCFRCGTCAETSISKLPVKILTSAVDSLTSISL